MSDPFPEVPDPEQELPVPTDLTLITAQEFFRRWDNDALRVEALAVMIDTIAVEILHGMHSTIKSKELCPNCGHRIFPEKPQAFFPDRPGLKRLKS